ncbi:MAG: DUF502 domain-containing protein [Chitinophagaceae bacterium]|nr:DUF502 domain-containing protein [Chitinophagaceae bacterium]
MKWKNIAKGLFQYFLQGLIILAPIAITAYAVTALFNFVDNILPDILENIFPYLFGVDEKGNPAKLPGFGFALVVLIVILVGYVSSSFIVSRLVELFDMILERTPGIKIIYSTLKDFFEAFAGNKRKFNRSVLVCVQDRDVWQIGFITQTEVNQFGLQDYVAVYVPKSYAFAGQLYFVKKDRIKLAAGISAADAMKFAISGGVTEIEDDPPLKIVKEKDSDGN